MGTNNERKKPLVSIVLPVRFTDDQHGKYGQHQRFWFAVKCLSRLLVKTPRSLEDPLFELIIIDNASFLTEGDLVKSIKDEKYAGGDSLDITPEGYFAAADVLIRNQTDVGFGVACNQGFALCRGDYVVCLQDDILLWEGWLDRLIKDFERKRESHLFNIGTISPALVRETDDARIALSMRKEDINFVDDANQIDNAGFSGLWMARKEVIDLLTRLNGRVVDPLYRGEPEEECKLWEDMEEFSFHTYRTHSVKVFSLRTYECGEQVLTETEAQN